MGDLITARLIGYIWVAIGILLLVTQFRKWWRESGGWSGKPLEQTIPKPTQAEGRQQEANEAQPPPVKKKPTALKPLAVHEGILLAAGFAKSEYGYSSYRLEIQSDELGVSHEIWGIDLNRALGASGAKIGDRIRASLAGRVETSLNDEGSSKVKKKIWDVTKLE